jgi:hypothetical protein
MELVAQIWAHTVAVEEARLLAARDFLEDAAYHPLILLTNITPTQNRSTTLIT